MRRFYHFRREKRSVCSQNPLRAPAQSTAFSNRRFNRRAAQNRSTSDSAQACLQNHAASASQLSMYKASCAGFTTLLRFGIKPCALPNSRASAQTYFKKHRRTKPLSIRFHASPATLSHPAPPAPDSPYFFASASNPAPRSSARTPFKKNRRTKPLSIRFRASPATLSHPAPSAGFAAFLRFGIKLRALLNSRSSARTPFKNHRRTKTLSIRFHASPETLSHPAHPAPDSLRSFD